MTEEVQETEQETETVLTDEGDEQPEKQETNGEDKAVQADWRAAIEDEALRKHAERFTSPADLAKAHLDLRKQLSDKPVTRPEEGADEKAWETYRSQNNIPVKAEDYTVDLPEGMELTEADNAFIDTLKPLAHEHDLPASAFAGFALKFKELEQQIVNEHAANVKQARDKAEDALRNEWGNEYATNVEVAKRAVNSLGGDDIKELFNTVRTEDGGALGDHPGMVRMFARLGRQMSEDGVIQPVDADTAKDLNTKRQELTAQIHAAQAAGDSRRARELDRERAALTDRLEGGGQPIVGAPGRTV